MYFHIMNGISVITLNECKKTCFDIITNWNSKKGSSPDVLLEILLNSQERDFVNISTSPLSEPTGYEKSVTDRNPESSEYVFIQFIDL